jgi:hypothetical protein
VDPLFVAVTRIITSKAGKPVGIGSGFFYRSGESLFLVSNLHVFIDPKLGVCPDTARIKVHTDAHDLARNADVDLPLYSAGSPRWRSLQDIDVAALPVASDLDKKHVISVMTAAQLPPDDIRIQPGQDVLVLGYPLGWADEYNNLPIVRQGILASAYGSLFDGRPVCLIDARLHRGTSGSPVITKPSIVTITADGRPVLGGPTSFLLGVHSAALLPGDEAGMAEVVETGPLDLNLCWYSRIVEDLTKS